MYFLVFIQGVLGLPVVTPILPSVQLDFLAGECIDPGLVSRDTVGEVAGPLTLALRRELPDQP